GRPPERRQATGPRPTPRGLPRPARLAAPGVQASRRWRLVGVTHRGGRPPVGSRTGLGGGWADPPPGLGGAPPPRPPSARGSHRPPGPPARPGGRGLARAGAAVARLSPLRLAPRAPSPPVAGSRSPARAWRRPAVAAVAPSAGGWPDRPGVDAARSPPVAGAAVAPAPDSLHQEAGGGAGWGAAQGAPRQAQGQGRGLENRCRGLLPGGWTSLRRLGRGPETIAAASRYATGHRGGQPR